MSKLFILIAFFLFLPCQVAAECFYANNYGVVIKVKNLNAVPSDFKSYAYCPGEEEKNEFIEILNSATSIDLAKPEDIKLEGSIRSETISSTLGTIELRWPRKVEGIFGRTPLRATTDAARTVARAIRSPAFPNRIQKIDLPWKIIFIDQEQLSNNTIPDYLQNGCHPGWMTAPANIYIVAERVAYNCSDKKTPPSSADKAMTQVLVHEMGHALEFHMLKSTVRDPDARMRAEGFASWFEYYAADYSSLLSRKQIKDEFIRRAKFSMNSSKDNFVFSGTAEDYARASMYFFSIADKRGARGLMSVYRKMQEEDLSFFEGVQKALGWSKDRLSDEANRFVGVN